MNLKWHHWDADNQQPVYIHYHLLDVLLSEYDYACYCQEGIRCDRPSNSLYHLNSYSRYHINLEGGEPLGRYRYGPALFFSRRKPPYFYSL